jgi:hemerythrin-like metal-binding protein
VSLGVVTVNPSVLASPEQVVELADGALYEAKNGGRNRFVVAERARAETAGGHVHSADLVHLVWHISNESGNPVIDAQHRRLFESANSLLSAVVMESSRTECTALMNALLSEVVDHFQDEEAIIGSAGYPDIEEHHRCHEKLVARAVFLADKNGRGDLTIGELFSFLAYDVVAQHMFVEDKKFFPYIPHVPVGRS